MEFVKFNALEAKVKAVLQEQTQLKTRNQELEGLLKEKENALKQAENSIRELNEERDDVRAKVDALLGLLEGIGKTA